MATPSLYPMFLKAATGGGSVAAGTVYVETFGAELLEMIEVEIVEMDIDVQIVQTDIDVDIVEIIDVEILC